MASTRTPPTQTPRSGTPRSPTKPRVLRPVWLRVSDACVVPLDSTLEGTIALGESCILHPRSSVIVGDRASLSLGRGCVVEETARIIVPPGHDVVVGEYNSFMVGCRAELVADVGSWNTFSPRSDVRGVGVGDQCTLGSGTWVGPDHPAAKRRDVDADGDAPMARYGEAPVLPNRTVIYGSGSKARTWDGVGEAQEMEMRKAQVAYLADLLPRSTKQRDEVRAYEESKRR